MGESREREGVSGSYTEHYDDDGNKIGESRKREGIFGDYTEHTDLDGNKVGESREREGIFGDYTEHTGREGRKTGESREIAGVFGDYVEHTDSEGRKIGESRERDGVFGKYTENTGSGHLPQVKGVTTDSEGSLGWLGEMVAVIGFVIGAIAGFIEAMGSAEGFMGYLIYIGIGAFAGVLIMSLAAIVLPWAIGLAVIVLILRACGV